MRHRSPLSPHYNKQGDRLRNSVDKIIRIGDKKEAGALRPLKLHMKNVESAKIAIKHGKHLRQLQEGETNGYCVNFKRVFISPDLSREERSSQNSSRGDEGENRGQAFTTLCNKRRKTLYI